jgi:hypothetical protein
LYARRPTISAPDFSTRTTEGVTFIWSLFCITRTSPPAACAMHEFVVPRSMPKSM